MDDDPPSFSLNPSSSRYTLLAIGDRSKGWWRKAAAILTFVSISCIIAVIALGVKLYQADSSGSCSADTSCYTPDCLKAASHVNRLVNRSAASPCEDFYTFACHNFPRLYPRPPGDDNFDMLDWVRDQNVQKLRRVVEALPSTDHDPEHYESKVKNFYLSCLDHMRLTGPNGTRFIREVVAPSGGWWGLAGDDNWPPVNYSFQGQLEKICVDYWTDAFFAIVVEDVLHPGPPSIDIFMGGIGGGKGFKPTAEYRLYVKTVGRLLIRDAGLQLSEDEVKYRLDTFTTDALQVEALLIEIFHGIYSVPKDQLLELRPLWKLNQDSQGLIDWVHLVTYAFNTDSTLVTANTSVRVYVRDFAKNLTRKINDLDSANRTRILNNYMVWRLANSFAGQLSCEYRHAEVVGEDVAKFPDASTVCLKQMNIDLKQGLEALFVREHFVDPSNRVAHEIADYVKEAILESLSNTNHWMSPESRDYARQKIRKTLFVVRFLDAPTYNETGLNNLYRSITMDRHDYLSNVLSLRALERSIQAHYLGHPREAEVWFKDTVVDVDLHYQQMLTEMVAPAGTLQFPLFDVRDPYYMNFGSTGSMLARTFLDGIDYLGNSFAINGSKLPDSWWSALTRERYNSTVLPCFTEAYSNYTMGPFPGFEDKPINVSHRYINKSVVESSEIRLAYKAYLKWAEDKGKELEMAGHNFTNHQLFFISYAQSHCFNMKITGETIRVMKYKPTNRIRVNGALAQLPEFQDNFHCHPSSPMVAEKRCPLF